MIIHLLIRFQLRQYRAQWPLFTLLMFSHLCLFQEAIQLDGEILFALLRRVSPLAFRHLEKHKIDPILYMTEWFMCAFSRTLPWASVLRVWDMFLCDGNKSSQHWSCSYARCCRQRVAYSLIITWLFSYFRGEDNFPCGFGAAEVHAGDSGEAEGLPGPVWDHGASPSHRPSIHAGGLPHPWGKSREAAAWHSEASALSPRLWMKFLITSYRSS